MQYHQNCKLAECVSVGTKWIFLKINLKPEKSWIVIDIDSLLQKIHGNIFAPVGLLEHIFQPTQAGVLRWSQITRQLPDQLDPSLVVAFLHRLEFCQTISDSEVLNLILGVKHHTSGQVSHDNNPESSDETTDMDGPTRSHPTEILYIRSRSEPTNDYLVISM